MLRLHGQWRHRAAAQPGLRLQRRRLAPRRTLSCGCGAETAGGGLVTSAIDEGGRALISPLVGEMPGRAEGGRCPAGLLKPGFLALKGGGEVSAKRTERGPS